LIRWRGEGLTARWSRRAVSFTVLAALWLLSVASLVALPLVAAADALRRGRLAWTRGLLCLVTFLTCEVLGLAAAGGLWLLKPFLGRDRWLDLHSRLQRRWAGALFGALRRIFGLHLELLGREALAAPGPLVVLSRHTSTVDTLLPVLALGERGLRYVLKRELLWDPCLDVVGQRLPNRFVRRGSGDPAAEASRLAPLAADLGPRDAAVIFPEGTRFTPAKRERVLASLGRSADPETAARAGRLRRLLPPRLAGTRALLTASPSADVVLLNHRGLESVHSLASLWNGSLIGRRIEVHLTRVAAVRVPRDRDQLDDWLWDAWSGMDAWLVGVPTSQPEAA
jgi:1-acyl-sn-glycerol-3-phosphate acyltransferase